MLLWPIICLVQLYVYLSVYLLPLSLSLSLSLLPYILLPEFSICHLPYSPPNDNILMDVCRSKFCSLFSDSGQSYKTCHFLWPFLPCLYACLHLKNLQVKYWSNLCSIWPSLMSPLVCSSSLWIVHYPFYSFVIRHKVNFWKTKFSFPLD